MQQDIFSLISDLCENRPLIANYSPELAAFLEGLKLGKAGKSTDKTPDTGSKVLCRLKHFHTGSIREHVLVKVNEDDCEWRTADDNSEISYGWDVFEWKEQVPK